MKFFLKLCCFSFLFFLICPFPTAAQESRSYFYETIDVRIAVNADSTFDVEERQTFVYQGRYNLGWRAVSLQKTDGISDISVIDGTTGRLLEHSSKRLDKLDPRSWGKFTNFRESNNQNIEWYYDLADTTHVWIIKYKVHGGIEFNKDSDRLYWNIFTDYEVPVNSSGVSVRLPDQTMTERVNIHAYRNQDIPIGLRFFPDSQEFGFYAESFQPLEDFTIDLSWPKGLISRSAYWVDFFQIYYGYILSALVVVLGLITG